MIDNETIVEYLPPNCILENVSIPLETTKIVFYNKNDNNNNFIYLQENEGPFTENQIINLHIV